MLMLRCHAEPMIRRRRHFAVTPLPLLLTITRLPLLPCLLSCLFVDATFCHVAITPYATLYCYASHAVSLMPRQVAATPLLMLIISLCFSFFAYFDFSSPPGLFSFFMPFAVVLYFAAYLFRHFYTCRPPRRFFFFFSPPRYFCLIFAIDYAAFH